MNDINKEIKAAKQCLALFIQALNSAKQLFETASRIRSK